jgi:hypothetical protein
VSELCPREPHPLGRERIPCRTIVSAIGDEEAYPVRCPRCAAALLRLGASERPAFLDVDDDGTATCATCGLSIPGLLAPLEEDRP